MTQTTSTAFLLRAIAAAALCGAASSTIAVAQTETTLPSSETVRSLLMNNWTDTVAIHYARQLHNADPEQFGPYLSALHNAADWPVNQIDGATAFFRAEVVDDGTGTQPTLPEQPPMLCEASDDPQGDNLAADPGVAQSYPSIMCFDDGGVLNVEYVRETERGLPIQIVKSYAVPPNQRFVVVQYTLTNNTAVEENRSVQVRVAEVVDLNNKAALDHVELPDALVDTGIHEPQPGQPINDITAQWDPELNAWIADMSAANGTFLVFGAYQEMDLHRAFETVSDELPFNEAVAPEMESLDQPEAPESVEEAAGQDLGLSMWSEATIGPGEGQQYAFFYAVTSSLEEAQAIAGEARPPMTPEVWFDETRAAYVAWLEGSVPVDTADPGLGAAYARALVAIKQSQQPEFGSFVAATNPAYGFKVWPRDSSVTALGLAAAGHLDEAKKYYQWMASVQEDGSQEEFPTGTWYSNYSYWVRKRPKHFVEPEWDSLGLFMIGVHHTWRLLNEQDPIGAMEFLTGPFERLDQGPASIYEAVTRAADYISGNINEHNFGPADHSIWEEDLEFAAFTQTTYGSGLNAAGLLAEQMGETDRANAWFDAGRRVLDAIHRAASAQPCPGLWNDAESRWNRGTWPNCTRDDRLDAAADLVWVFGLVDANDDRTLSQRDAVLSRLSQDGIGIARYEGDEFYHTRDVSPGGQFEASASMPSWPQMDMYMAMLEHWQGIGDVALQRLQWYVSVTNVGYMPPGEAVDWQTDRPLPSTSVEPVTGAWYLLGLLNHLDLFDPRLPPLVEPAVTE